MRNKSVWNHRVHPISVASSFAMIAVDIGSALLLTFFAENELVSSLFRGYRYIVFLVIGVAAVHLIEKNLLLRKQKHELGKSESK